MLGRRNVIAEISEYNTDKRPYTLIIMTRLLFMLFITLFSGICTGVARQQYIVLH